MKPPRPFLRPRRAGDDPGAPRIYYFKRRVPLRYASVDPRGEIFVSLKTDSLAEATVKAAQVWNEMIGAWEARLKGSTDDADVHLAAARELAARRGYAYLPAAEVSGLPTADLVKRLLAVIGRDGKVDMLEAKALLGGARAPALRVSQALDLYWPAAKDKTFGKSPDQVRRWRNPRIKAVETFLKAVGDRSLDEISTKDLHAMRGYLLSRMEAGEIKSGSANKDMIHFLTVVETVARANDVRLAYDRKKLLISADDEDEVPPFSETWIRERLLAPGALDGLNPEARALLLGMVNTGYRPSEAAQMTRAQIRVDAEIPHLIVEPVTGPLKTRHSARILPLAGVSLEAFREFPDGFPRYRKSSATLSGTVNSFLAENNLRETPDHTMYSLRHSFSDRLVNADVHERIKRDLMGHKLDTPRYGQGGYLETLAAAIAKIAI